MNLVATCAKYLAINSAAARALIHHPSKNVATSLRGHSSLPATAHSIISITSDDNTGIRTATLIKSRDTAGGAQVHFGLEVIKLPDADCFGDPRTTCIVVPALASEMPRKRPGSEIQE